MTIKHYSYLILFLLSFSCKKTTSEQNETDTTSTTIVEDTAEIPVNDTTVNTSIEEDASTHYMGLKNQSILNRDELQFLLRDLNISKWGDEIDQIPFRIITQEAENLLQPCEYDENGAFRFLIGQQKGDEIFKAYPYPIIAHDHQDASYFYIEEISIRNKGREFSIKVQRFRSEEGEFFLDMADNTEYWTIIIDDEDRPILQHPTGSYMLLNDRAKLPKAKCEENYH